MELKLKYISLSFALALLAVSCQKSAVVGEMHQLEIFTEIEPFGNEPQTKVNDEGTTFVKDDWIRVKIICPFTSNWQQGESTSGGSVDDFYLLKHTAESGSRAWRALEASDCCDIDAGFSYSNAPSLPGIYESQPTPYVYTASTWSEEKVFKTESGIVNQFCHVFHADQSRQKDYRASDLLWAQQYMQTGSWNVHLSFRHVLSCIKFTIDDSALPDGSKLSADAKLTVEGMPAIDGQEILVGNYYASKAKRDVAYGYRNQVNCDYKSNGKVLGIGVNDYVAKRSACKPFSEIANNATYRAYRTSTAADKTFRLIVPPVTLSEDAVVWLRDGERRYTQKLGIKDFEQGMLYNVTIKLTQGE